MRNESGTDSRGGFKVVGKGDDAGGAAEPDQAAAQPSDPSAPPQALRPRILVVGLGGAGGNAIHNMLEGKLEGVEFLAANTDAQALESIGNAGRIQLGRELTGGLGAGARPEVGRGAAEESLDQVLAEVEGASLVFIAAGMGGGTGTGASPVIAEAIRRKGILTVAVVTKPFRFEGAHRMAIAEQGILELQDKVDTLIVIPNQNLFKIATEKTSVADAFHRADSVLFAGVRGVTDLMIKPGLINLDFADFRTIMTLKGKAIMGAGEADGPQRAVTAAEAAVANPLLEDNTVDGARGVLINVTGGRDLTLFELDEAVNSIRANAHPDANIILGSSFDESLKGKIRVSVLATGITEKQNARAGEAQPAAPARTSVAAAPAVIPPKMQPKPAEETRHEPAARAETPAMPETDSMAATPDVMAKEADAAPAKAETPAMPETDLKAATPDVMTTEADAAPAKAESPQPAETAAVAEGESQTPMAAAAVAMDAEAEPSEAQTGEPAAAQAPAAADDPAEAPLENPLPATATVDPHDEAPAIAALSEARPAEPEPEPRSKGSGLPTLDEILERAGQLQEAAASEEAAQEAPSVAPEPELEPPQAAQPEPEAQPPDTAEYEDDEINIDLLIEQVLLRNRRAAADSETEVYAEMPLLEPEPETPMAPAPESGNPASGSNKASTDALLEDLAFSLATDDETFQLENADQLLEPEPEPEPPRDDSVLDDLLCDPGPPPEPAAETAAKTGEESLESGQDDDQVYAELDRRARERARAAIEGLSLPEEADDTEGQEALEEEVESTDDALRRMMKLPSFLREKDS